MDNEIRLMNQKIKDVKTLEDIKRFLCPKSSGNPMTCMDCPGKDNCRAGQKAIKLLEKATKPRANGKPEKARIKYIAALSSEDPVQWLLDSGVPTVLAAKEFLYRSKSRYPDIYNAHLNKTAPFAPPEAQPAEPSPAAPAEPAVPDAHDAPAAPAAEDDDLVSVEDLLKEVGATQPKEEPAEEAPGQAAPAQEEMPAVPAVPEAPAATAAPATLVSDDVLRGGLQEKLNGFTRKREEAEAEKRRLEERIRELDGIINDANSNECKILNVLEMLSPAP